MASTSEDYIQFQFNIKKKYGIDLNLYKENQMKRRLTSFREKKGFVNFSDFYKGLEADDQLYKEFLDRITINVSEFFRNKNRWEVLNNKIIPLLLNDGQKRLKCWSAACSTGEEPYTLSMIQKNNYSGIDFNISATDLDENVLMRAQQGIYSANSLKEVPKEYKDKYFNKDKELYRVNPEIKNSVKFYKNDLLLDDFGCEYDLIICRNVIIYFTDEAKIKLYKKFSNSLKDGGILFVGSTEQIFNPIKYNFSMIDNFFYQKK